MNAMNELGSLQAAQAIASSIKTLLGPSKSAKCCINGEDDSDAIICRNAAKVLQYLEVEHPVGYIINDACQAVYKTYGCGCKTLVCMIGFWSRSAGILQQELLDVTFRPFQNKLSKKWDAKIGVPVSIITQLFDEALFKCLQVFEEIGVPIQEALDKSSKVGIIPSKHQGLLPDNPSTNSRSSTFLFDKLWIDSDNDINELDVTQTSDGGLLTSDVCANFSHNASGVKSVVHATERHTLNLVDEFPKNNKLIAAQHYLINEENSLKESMALNSKEDDDEFDSCFDCPSVHADRKSNDPEIFGKDILRQNNEAKRKESFGEITEKVNDEFDGCFDGYMEDIPVKDTSSEKPYRSSLSSSKEAGLSKSKTKRQKGDVSLNYIELAKTNQMLKNLGISGHNLKSTKPSAVRNFSEILKSSRNLSVVSPKTPVEKDISKAKESSVQASYNLDIGRKENLVTLGKMLSHGKDKEMTLAVEVIFNQMSSNGNKANLDTFEVDKNAINIETIVGPTSNHSRVVDGILFRQTSSLQMQFPPAPVRAVLVNGDITEDFRHVGFKDSFQTKRVFQKKSYNKLYTNDTSWLQRIIEVLQRLNIGAVFARGIIDKDLEDYCQALNIQTFSSISSKTLQLLTCSLCSTTVVYLLDLQESHIGRPVLLRQWEGSQLGAMDTASFVILEVVGNRKTDKPSLRSVNNSDGFRHKGKKYKENNGLLQTVLLCGSSEQLLMDLELAFWNCVFRLRNTVNCGRVLQGAGRTELACIKKLRELSENFNPPDSKPGKSSSWLQASLPCYRPVVYTAFADGLVEFLISVLSNSGHVMNHGQAHAAVQEILNDNNQELSGRASDYRDWQHPLVADDFIAKKNAWRRAVGVVCLMLNSDTTIVTGTKSSTET